MLETSTLAPEFVWFAAAFIATFGTARIARLFTFDEFPPTYWLRQKWIAKAGPRWGELALCPFCLGPYLAAINFAFAYFSDFHWTWWVANGVASLAYFAGIIVAYDDGN